MPATPSPGRIADPRRSTPPTIARWRSAHSTPNCRRASPTTTDIGGTTASGERGAMRTGNGVLERDRRDVVVEVETSACASISRTLGGSIVRHVSNLSNDGGDRRPTAVVDASRGDPCDERDRLHAVAARCVSPSYALSPRNDGPTGRTLVAYAAGFALRGADSNRNSKRHDVYEPRPHPTAALLGPTSTVVDSDHDHPKPVPARVRIDFAGAKTAESSHARRNPTRGRVPGTRRSRFPDRRVHRYRWALRSYSSPR